MLRIESDLKNIMKVTLKARHDELTDQFNRLIMVKLLMVCCFIMGISWFTDSITCVVPGIFIPLSDTQDPIEFYIYIYIYISKWFELIQHKHLC